MLNRPCGSISPAPQHAVLDKLGPQAQVEEPAVPGHAAGEVSDRQLDLRDPVQPGNPGRRSRHLLPPAARLAGPDAVLPGPSAELRTSLLPSVPLTARLPSGRR
jgi:hypothetical protein